jgi:hypothetical protein
LEAPAGDLFWQAQHLSDTRKAEAAAVAEKAKPASEK